MFGHPSQGSGVCSGELLGRASLGESHPLSGSPTDLAGASCSPSPTHLVARRRHCDRPGTLRVQSPKGNMRGWGLRSAKEKDKGLHRSVTERRLANETPWVRPWTDQRTLVWPEWPEWIQPPQAHALGLGGGILQFCPLWGLRRTHWEHRLWEMHRAPQGSAGCVSYLSLGATTGAWPHPITKEKQAREVLLPCPGYQQSSGGAERYIHSILLRSQSF